ncbi:hypothetical protein V5O48_013651 [Marasmius crinis-equi]|uniref:Protein kinase domain-containing protein n=1 Tax=Marasmius crinis-equi TaxID=585013 RepID=A0ABR3EZV9_9AGAR
MSLGTETLVVLLFGLKLVKVHTQRWYHVTNLLTDILQSKNHDLPQEVRDIMQKWKPRQLRYHTLRRPLSVNNLDDIPTQFGEDNVMQVPSEGFTTDCTHRRLPDDGSCLNMIVEEPLSIEELQGEERFRSREVVLYLRQFGVEIYPISYDNRVNKRLKKYDPSSYNVAAQLISSHRLPTGDYLITMGMYGDHLVEVMQCEPELLAGPVVLKIVQQLCTAVDFLHSHNRFHLDIKPENLVLDIEGDCDLTVVDLGWVLHAKCSTAINGASGTYHYAPPEVRLWYEYEEEREQAKGPVDRPLPSSYFPREADAWAVGNVISIVLRRLSLEELEVDGSKELSSFAKWMMDKRPKMEVALKRLDLITTGVLRTPSPIDSAVDIFP